MALSICSTPYHHVLLVDGVNVRKIERPNEYKDFILILKIARNKFNKLFVSEDGEPCYLYTGSNRSISLFRTDGSILVHREFSEPFYETRYLPINLTLCFSLKGSCILYSLHAIFNETIMACIARLSYDMFRTPGETDNQIFDKMFFSSRIPRKNPILQINSLLNPPSNAPKFIQTYPYTYPNISTPIPKPTSEIPKERKLLPSYVSRFLNKLEAPMSANKKPQNEVYIALTKRPPHQVAGKVAIHKK